MKVIGVIIAVVSAIVEVVKFVMWVTTSPIVKFITFVVNVVAPIVETITKTIKLVSGLITDPVARIANVLTGGLTDAVAELNEKIIIPVIQMRKALEDGIKGIVVSAAGPFAAVISPLKESLITINGFVKGVETQVTTDLEPIKDVVRFVRTLSSTKIATVLVGETQVMADTISWVTGKEGAAVGYGISQLWNSTVDSIVGISTALDDNVKFLNDEIRDAEIRMREDQAAALANIERQTKESVSEVYLQVQAQTDETNRRTAMAMRRIEDVPFFREMLVKALS